MELANADDPARITAALRESVRRKLDAWPANAATLGRLREDLQHKVSFHLMAPMTEAYFFADPSALARAIAPLPARPSRFDPETDVEAFTVDDPDYLGPPTDPTSRWRTATGRQGHPKRYLAYLTDVGPDGGYRESRQGVDALGGLDWPRVLRRPVHTRFARSLLADLADMLGAPSGRLAAEPTHPLTWPPPRDPVLRNL